VVALKSGLERPARKRQTLLSYEDRLEALRKSARRRVPKWPNSRKSQSVTSENVYG